LICSLLCCVPPLIGLGTGVFSLLHRKYQTRLAERKQREHEAWLLTPEGQTWHEKQREAQRQQREEEDRRRREAEESAARAKWKHYHESKTMDDISKMSGVEFEEFLVRLFERMAYTHIKLTATNDQGGDLLCSSPRGARTVIQAKRWQGTVGNGAVQELLGAMVYYGCAEGMVVTNSTFSEAARQLAAKDARISLCDGRWLADQVKRFLPPEVPEFTWDAYNAAVKDWRPVRAGKAGRAKSRRYRRRR
jgi:restriction endonuclease Mrr